MGLLDFFGDPQANMAMAAGLLSGGSFGQALGRGMAGGQAMQIGAQEKRLREAQANEYAMRAERAKQEQAQQQAAAERDAMFQQALQRGYKPAELAVYFPEKVDLLKKLSEAPNFGRQAVARTIDGVDENNRPVTFQVDQFGEKIGAGIGQWKAPVQVSRGDRIDFTSPVDFKTLGSFSVNMSPSERDASARGWAGVKNAQERLAMDKEQAGQPKPQFHDGQWITPPTTQNPQGSAVPVQGYVKQPGEAAKKQLSGIESLNGAINEYVVELGNWDKTKMLSPDARAAMGTKYNNMMLQAKEAYNLGVLNGPDYKILTSIVSDPTAASSAFLSNDAMKKQATELSRIMGATAKATRGAGANAEASAGSPKTARTPVAQGVYGGRKVIKYSDGSTDYAD